MSGLCGIWSLSSPLEELERAMERQLRTMADERIPAGVDRHVVAGAAMAVHRGIFDDGPQPAISKDGRYALLLDGEVFNCEELRKAYRIDPASGDASSPNLCLQLFLEHGERVLREFNGQFVIALFDNRDRRLRLITDRFGFRPVFYKEGPAHVVFASTLKAIRAADPEIPAADELGSLELFCYGTNVFDRSWIRGYLRLPPSTILTVDSRGVRRDRYWAYRFEQTGERLDQATYFTVFAKLLDRAVERRMVGQRRIGVFLSGGYDSRAVAGAIRRHHLPLTAFTFGLPESRDARFAALLAERLGFQHRLLTPRRPYLAAHCRSIVWRNEGLVPFAQNTSLIFHEEIKSRADFILTGFLGEYSGSHTWPRLLRTRARGKAIPVIFERMLGGRPQTCRRIFNNRFYERTFEHLRTEFERSFEKLSNDHPLDLSDAWDFTFRHPWSYQAAAVDRPLLEVRAPQLDTDLVDFLLGIPWHARLEQRVYKKMIAYAYPAIRDVPCTNSARPIDPGFVREYLKMTGRYLARRLVEPVLPIIGRRRPLGRELSDLAEDFRAEPELIEDVLDPLLEDGTFEPSMFDIRGIRRLIDEHYTGTARHETVLAQLISWGLASKFVLQQEPDTVGLPAVGET